MRLSRTDYISNVPLLKIRNFLCKYRDCQITIDQFREQMIVYADDINRLLDNIISEGYIEKNEEGLLELTQKGLRLCSAKCIKPLNKEKADKIFNEFMDRVSEINSNDNYLYKVGRVLLFGSYINPEAIDYGDIDIAVELEKRYNCEDFIVRDELLRIEVKEKGKQFSSLVDELFYTYDIVLKALKKGNRYISLQLMKDVEVLGCPTKQVFP